MPEPLGERYFLDRFAVATPDKPAVIMAGSGERRTYLELERASNRIAWLLRGAGLKRGDHVAFLIENCPQYYEVVWACLRSGLYYTPVNTRLTVPEAAYVTADCGARALFVSAAFGAVAQGLLGEDLPAVTLRCSVGGAIEGYGQLEECTAGMPDMPVPEQSEGRHMIYSSGTTGRPKGVKLPLPSQPLGERDAFLDVMCKLFQFDQNTVYLCPAPLYHGAGHSYTVAMQRLGATAVVMEKFSSEGFLAAVERYRVTHTQLVPTMFVRLLRLPEAERRRHDLSSLQVAIHAAAPCPIPVKEQMLDWWGPILYEYYAATEANGFTFIGPQEWLKHRGSVGRAVLGTPHIVGEGGRECARGEPGMIYFEGTTPFTYHNDASKTAEARLPTGWTTTGDIGYLDNEGYLYLTDRKAYMIISGGVNIYPQESENVLAAHPAVLDVAVFGVPDPEFGEAVKAVVQLADASRKSDAVEAELLAYCRERLAHYKCPKSIDFLDALPREPNGKLYKRLLRERYWGGHDTRIV